MFSQGLQSSLSPHGEMTGTLASEPPAANPPEDGGYAQESLAKAPQETHMGKRGQYQRESGLLSLKQVLNTSLNFFVINLKQIVPLKVY